jgi:hypothetical protein
MANKIKPEEIRAVAMYFTMSNMCLLELVPQYEKNIERAYYHVDGIVQDETGTSCNDELKSWITMIKKEKANGYCYTEWQKVKEKWEIS